MPAPTDMERFLARLPAALAARFDPEQLAAIELHFAMRSRANHSINWRKRLRLGGLRGYVVVLAGRDRKHD